MSLPSDVAALADAYYVRQAETARQVANLVQRSYTSVVDPAQWWDEQGLAATQAIRAGQSVAVTRSSAYVQLVAEVQDAADEYAVNAVALISPDEAVDGMLFRSLSVVDDAVAGGATLAEAKAIGLRSVVTLASSLVSDAGQNAAGVATAANPRLSGYYRKLRLPSCDRCAVMAGRWYGWNDGFLRHPGCDCVHVPAAKAFGSGFDPRRAILSGQVTGLSKANVEAIELGADPSQVINTRAKGALYDVGAGLQATTTGTTVRGRYGRTAGQAARRPGTRYRVADAPRLTPTAVLRLASSRTEAIELLTRYGYIAA